MPRDELGVGRHGDRRAPDGIAKIFQHALESGAVGGIGERIVRSRRDALSHQHRDPARLQEQLVVDAEYKCAFERISFLR